MLSWRAENVSSGATVRRLGHSRPRVRRWSPAPQSTPDTLHPLPVDHLRCKILDVRLRGRQALEPKDPITHDSLHQQLTALARPWLETKLANPVVSSLLDGSLDGSIMSRWLEQDHIYLYAYTRAFARVASLAPDRHVATLVDGAHYTAHVELSRVDELATLFGADLTQLVPGPACARYVDFLATNSTRFASGVISMLPCMMGFASLGLVIEAPEEPRYRRWVEIYAESDFQDYTRRFAAIVDEVPITFSDASAIFEEGMAHEIALWNDAADFAAEG